MTATHLRVSRVHPEALRTVPLPTAVRRRRAWRPVMALRGVVIGVLWGGCLWALGVAVGRAMFGQGTTAAGLAAAGLAAAGWAVCSVGQRGKGR